MEVFEAIDFSEPVVQKLFIGMTLAILAIALFIAWVFYKLNLIVPRSRLLDDAFVGSAVRRFDLLLKVCRVVLAAAVGLLVFLGLLHWMDVIDAVSKPFLWVTLSAACVALVFAPMVFKHRGRGWLHTKAELESRIYVNRVLLSARNMRRQQREEARELRRQKKDNEHMNL